MKSLIYVRFQELCCSITVKSPVSLTFTLITRFTVSNPTKYYFALNILNEDGFTNNQYIHAIPHLCYSRQRNNHVNENVHCPLAVFKSIWLEHSKIQNGVHFRGCTRFWSSNVDLFDEDRGRGISWRKQLYFPQFFKFSKMYVVRFNSRL